MTTPLPGEVKYTHLLQPAQVGRFRLRNRVKYAACSVSNFNAPDGHVTEREYARMEVIAKTGCGLITNQGAYPDPKGEGKAYFRQLAIHSDEYIPDFRRIADMLHAAGAVAIQQILHGGRYGGIYLDYALQPSAVPQTLRHFRTPREVSKEEIQMIVEQHAAGARRAMEAGFDGVEHTAFMGYLLANFLSSFTNKRTDEYGGSIEGRARFMIQLLEETRKAIGKDALLVIRLNGEELMDEWGGSKPTECIEFMKLAEQAGADMISIVIGWHESRNGALGRDVPTNGWLYVAERAKSALNIPIAFGPRFGDPVMADQALAEGKIDFWEVCRPFLADPELLHKVKEDRVEEIRPCVGGLLCLSRMFRNLPYNCAMNPRLSHEYEPAYAITAAHKVKKVMVVGGGPAGLEAAYIAAKRGHSVTVFDKRERLGGQLNHASKEIDGGDVWQRVISYYQTQLTRYGVDVRLNTEVNPDVTAKFNPDVVIVATGATLPRKSYPSSVLNSYDVLDEKVPVGQRVVLIGGERMGLVCAEYLAALGKQCTIVERGKRLGEDVIPTFKWRHTAWVKEYGIATMTSAKVKEIRADAVVVIDSDGKECVLPADTVIDAGPRESRQELINALEFSADEQYVVGDAVRPRSVHNAIRDGHLIGLRI